MTKEEFNQIPERCVQYVQSFNSKDKFVTISELYNKKFVYELTLEQFWNLFAYASKKDLFDNHNFP